MRVGQLEREVLELPVRDRIRIARRLLERVDDYATHEIVSRLRLEVADFEQAFAGAHLRPETEKDIARVERAIRTDRKRL